MNTESIRENLLEVRGTMDVKRKAFIKKHECWIDYLNDREKLKTLEKRNVHHVYKKQDGSIDHESDLDLRTMTNALKSWQKDNGLFDEETIKINPHLILVRKGIGKFSYETEDMQRCAFAIDDLCISPTFIEGEKHILLQTRDMLNNKVKTIPITEYKLKFQTEEELEIAMIDWMYENLRSITRGESRELKDVEKFGEREMEALLSTIAISTIWGTKTVSLLSYDYHMSDYTYLPELTMCLHRFIEYITEFLKGGLKDKAKLGFYKVGVCPYKKLKDKEACGKVFVARQWNQVACNKHAVVWRALKYYRK